MPDEIRIDVDGQAFVMKLVSKGKEGWNYSLSDEEGGDDLR